MIKNQALASLLFEHGGIATPTKESLHLRMPARAISRLMSERLGDVSSALSVQTNRSKLDAVLDKRDHDEAGGELSELITNLKHGADFKDHAKALELFERGGIGKRLKAEVNALKPRRKLKLSDEDGDFDYSRRFDDKFFVDSTIIQRTVKTIELYCTFNFSCGVGAASINKYSAFVWSACKIIEASGFQARVIFAIEVKNPSGQGSAPKNSRIEVVIKEHGEYVSPAILAAILSTLFFRRAGFALMILACDLIEAPVSYGLGQPLSRNKAIEFKDGRLVLSGSPSEGADEETIKEILKAFKNERTTP